MTAIASQLTPVFAPLSFSRLEVRVSPSTLAIAERKRNARCRTSRYNKMFSTLLGPSKLVGNGIIKQRTGSSDVLGI